MFIFRETTMDRKSLFLSAPLLFCLAAQAYAQTDLTVYTAIEAEDLDRYAQAFNADHPDIKINWVRDSTGVITAKLLAEKNNPQADMVWGLAATSLMMLKMEGMLLPYEGKAADPIEARYKDADQPPTWLGMNAWQAAICFNTVEGAKRGIAAPTSWEDLTKPEYAGSIVMPNPASSGTGYLDVSAWLQMWGEEKGWAYMDALHKNVASYTHSGSKPCKMAGSGEALVGISFAFRAAKTKTDGAPIDVIIPSEGIGWEMEASAVIDGTPNEEAAMTLLEWTVSPAAMEQYSKGWAIVSLPGHSKPVPNYPENSDKLMIENDLEWAAKNRATILKEWSTRYDSKTEAAG